MIERALYECLGTRQFGQKEMKEVLAFFGADPQVRLLWQPRGQAMESSRAYQQRRRIQAYVRHFGYRPRVLEERLDEQEFERLTEIRLCLKEL